jgi:excisionase family DNA binding protein
MGQFQEIGWMDLRTLAEYSSVGEKTLRKWIHAGENPLPAAQRGKKLYVNRAAFDEWLLTHAVVQKESGEGSCL